MLPLSALTAAAAFVASFKLSCPASHSCEVSARISTIARLDWAARAEFGDEVRVFLYDPVDRGDSRRWRADRVH